MTEAAHQMACNPAAARPRKPGSVGPAAGPEVAIMDDEGRLLPARAVGEVVIRGRNVTCGYANNPKANASAFTDGWFRTGDQGYFDEDGYLYLTGRLKEIINRAGEKISPREVDEVLLEHPAVAQALTFAMPDSRLGEDVAAAVVVRDGGEVTESDLKSLASSRLADYKVPRRIVFLKEIPKGPTGKLQRIGLAEKLGLTGDDRETAEGPREFVAPRTPTEEVLCEIWRTHLAVPRVGALDDFFALGGYSILAARILAEVERRFDRKLSMAALFDARTVESLAAIVDGTAAAPSLGPLVTIQRGGSRAPLFCAANANAFLFASLARRLGPEQPVYGLHPQGLVPEDAPASAFDIGALAAEYLSRVRELQPHGPYHLMGACSSGYIVWEMARRLRAAGEEVATLVLFDTPGPFRSLDRLDAVSRRVRRMAGRFTDRASAPEDPRPPLDIAYWEGLKAARIAYAPERYEGDILLIATPDELRRPGSGHVPRWRRYARSAEMIRLDVIHSEALHEPHVAAVAARLGQLLAAPAGTGTASVEPAPAAGRRPSGRAGAYVAPRTPIEETLAAVFAETLSRERVGVTDDWLSLGGDSILAARMIARVRNEMGVTVTLVDFFAEPTVEAVATEIVSLKAREAGDDEVARILRELEEE